LSADGIGDTRLCEAGGRASGAVCDERCLDSSECRSGFECQAGLCRTALAAVSGAGSGGQSSASLDAGSGGTAPGDSVRPLVMMLSDTSGSMERRANCLCSTLGCTECLPDCSAGTPSRWHELLGTLTGSFAPYACEAVERTAVNGATYDVGYSIPHYTLSAGVAQRPDGLFDTFAGRVRFASATFDGAPTRTGEPDQVPLSDSPSDFLLSQGILGSYSYAGGVGSPRRRPDGSAVGKFFYPSCTTDYIMDTGVQSPDAAGGALFMTDPQYMSDSMIALKANLAAVRPFGGTPIAAALDDLYYYFAEDAHGAPPRQASEARSVILVTDGYPDDDYRTYPSPGCACKTREECNGQDPALMSCPYPTAEDAALHLRCGFDGANCQGPIDKVYVVAYSIGDDQLTLDKLSAIAAAGGSEAVHRADNPVQLRATLSAIIEEISSDAAH
jgi:hypothetical protein